MSNENFILHDGNNTLDDAHDYSGTKIYTELKYVTNNKSVLNDKISMFTFTEEQINFTDEQGIIELFLNDASYIVENSMNFIVTASLIEGNRDLYNDYEIYCTNYELKDTTDKEKTDHSGANNKIVLTFKSEGEPKDAIFADIVMFYRHKVNEEYTEEKCTFYTTPKEEKPEGGGTIIEGGNVSQDPSNSVITITTPLKLVFNGKDVYEFGTLNRDYGYGFAQGSYQLKFTPEDINSEDIITLNMVSSNVKDYSDFSNISCKEDQPHIYNVTSADNVTVYINYTGEESDLVKQNIYPQGIVHYFGSITGAQVGAYTFSNYKSWPLKFYQEGILSEDEQTIINQNTYGRVDQFCIPLEQWQTFVQDFDIIATIADANNNVKEDVVLNNLTIADDNNTCFYLSRNDEIPLIWCLNYSAYNSVYNKAFGIDLRTGIYLFNSNTHFVKTITITPKEIEE